MVLVSSNSSVRESLGALLDESFTILRDEVPEANRRMCSRLEGEVVVICADDQSVVVACDGAAMRVQAGSIADASAEIRTSRRAILRVLDGEVTLADAVLAGAVSVRASLEALVRLNHGLAMYVHGAVRAPSFPRLLERFRRGRRPRVSRRSTRSLRGV
jgi:hypothetical protein